MAKKEAKKQKEYNIMVLKLLKELSKTPNARLSVREIARTLEINPMAVSRSLKELENLLDIKKGSNFEAFRLKVYLVRLKEEFEELEIDELIKKNYVKMRLEKEIFG